MNVPTTFPFFNGTRKQAPNRDGTPVVLFSPRTQLPPFLIQRPHVADDFIEGIVLIDCDGNETDIRNYFAAYGGYINGHGTFEAFDTLTPNANNIDLDSVIKTTTGAGTAGFWCTAAFAVTSGDKIYVSIDIDLDSGAAPIIELTEDSAPYAPKSNSEVLSDGENNVILTANATTTVHLAFYVATGNQSNFSARVTFSEFLEVHEYTDVDYIQYNGGALVKNEINNLITGWNNLAYDTFITSGTEITSAIDGTDGNAESTDTFSVTKGEILIINVQSLVLNSGAAPEVLIFDNDVLIIISETVQLAAGDNYVIFTITENATNAKLILLNISACDFSTGEIILYRKEDLLPRGTYYLKLTDGTNEWFSEWFNISDVYENLIAGLVNVDYETFVSTGTKAVSVIETGSDGKFFSQAANPFAIANDEVVTVIFFLTLNSGQLPEVRIISSATGSALTNGVTAAEGVNEIELTATFADMARLRFQNTGASNYSTSEIWVRRKYSPRFVKLQFTNDKDLHGKRLDDQTILYQEGFTQECWLQTILNTPGSNRVDVGQEKDGVFIAEKIITQYKYRIIDYLNRSLFEGLIRLPQHDDITIIDEVGNQYTPDVGNVQVSPEWGTFDTGDITIEWNDGSFVWVENADDIT